MKKFILIGTMFLSGCVASQQQIAAKCASYGFQYGTPEYSQCLMQVEAQNRAAVQQYWQNLSQQVQQADIEQQRAMQANRPSSTNCNFIGDTMHCSTW